MDFIRKIISTPKLRETKRRLFDPIEIENENHIDDINMSRNRNKRARTETQNDESVDNWSIEKEVLDGSNAQLIANWIKIRENLPKKPQRLFNTNNERPPQIDFSIRYLPEPVDENVQPDNNIIDSIRQPRIVVEKLPEINNVSTGAEAPVSQNKTYSKTPKKGHTTLGRQAILNNANKGQINPSHLMSSTPMPGHHAQLDVSQSPITAPGRNRISVRNVEELNKLVIVSTKSDPKTNVVDTLSTSFQKTQKNEVSKVVDKNQVVVLNQIIIPPTNTQPSTVSPVGIVSTSEQIRPKNLSQLIKAQENRTKIKAPTPTMIAQRNDIFDASSDSDNSNLLTSLSISDGENEEIIPETQANQNKSVNEPDELADIQEYLNTSANEQIPQEEIIPETQKSPNKSHNYETQHNSFIPETQDDEVSHNEIIPETQDNPNTNNDRNDNNEKTLQGDKFSILLGKSYIVGNDKNIDEIENDPETNLSKPLQTTFQVATNLQRKLSSSSNDSYNSSILNGFTESFLPKQDLTSRSPYGPPLMQTMFSKRSSKRSELPQNETIQVKGSNRGRKKKSVASLAQTLSNLNITPLSKKEKKKGDKSKRKLYSECFDENSPKSKPVSKKSNGVQTDTVNQTNTEDVQSSPVPGEKSIVRVSRAINTSTTENIESSSSSNSNTQTKASRNSDVIKMPPPPVPKSTVRKKLDKDKSLAKNYVNPEINSINTPKDSLNVFVETETERERSPKRYQKKPQKPFNFSPNVIVESAVVENGIRRSKRQKFVSRDDKPYLMREVDDEELHFRFKVMQQPYYLPSCPKFKTDSKEHQTTQIFKDN